MRTALVTGASRGIGAAIARALAARGLAVGVHCRTRRAEGEAVRASLPGAGHRLLSADLGSAAGCRALWDEALAALGAVDILVNNAGLHIAHPPLSTTFAAWQAAFRETLAANLEGPSHLMWLAAQHMAARASGDAWGRGRIVNVSSRGAFRGEPEAPAYGASKAGLNVVGQSLARALAPTGIYVYTLAPGWVETDMATGHLDGAGGADILAQHPLGRVARAEEIAAAAVFCALDAPATMTGAILDINGASYLRT